MRNVTLKERYREIKLKHALSIKNDLEIKEQS